MLADRQFSLTPCAQTDLELELVRLLEKNNGWEEIQNLKRQLESAYDEASLEGDRANDAECRVEDLEKKLKKSKALVNKLRTEPNENQLALLAHQAQVPD